MEAVVDLRLFGVMAFFAYVTFSFVGDAFNPLATSRRASRNLRLGYARSVAAVLLASPLVTLWVQVQSFTDGILWSLAAASAPLLLLSLGFGFVAFRHWKVRRRERTDPDFRDRDQAPVLTLDELRELNHFGETENSEIEQAGEAAAGQPEVQRESREKAPPV